MPYRKKINLGAVLAASLACLAACTRMEDPVGTGKPGSDTEGVSAALTSDPNVAGIGGCWSMRHGNYSGRLVLKQTGTSVVGFMDWEGHADAWVTGSVLANGVNMTFRYLYDKAGIVTQYDGTLYGSRLYGSNGGLQWYADPGACVSEELLSGCYRIEQGSYVGNLTINQFSLGGDNAEVSGYMDWQNHADAVVLGTFKPSTRRMTVSFTYPSGSGMYDAVLSADQMLLNGETYPPNNPNQRTPFTGWSRTCKDLTGCFSLQVHHGNQVWSQGTARINWNGYYLSGYVDWQGVGRVNLTGTHATRQIDFLQSLPGQNIDGNYTAKMSHEADAFWWGEQYRNGAKVGDFMGSRILCPAP